MYGQCLRLGMPCCSSRRKVLIEGVKLICSAGETSAGIAARFSERQLIIAQVLHKVGVVG